MTERAMRQNYVATVRILLTDDVDSEGMAADAISGLLTECGIYEGAIKDWSYMSEGDRWKHAELVDVPVDYDRDEDTIPGAAAGKEFAYVLIIDHRHGTNTSVHRTEEGARADLAAFCRQYAEDDAFILNADKMTDDEIIEAYFAVMNEHDEFYSIERTELLA